MCIRDSCPYSLYVVSGLRDPGRQWDLRRDRVGYANIWNPRYRGNPTTAVPARWNSASGRWEGGSRHQTGDAVDFGGSEAGMAYNETTNTLFITDASNIIRWYSVAGGCQLTLINRCIAPASAVYWATTRLQSALMAAVPSSRNSIV